MLPVFMATADEQTLSKFTSTNACSISTAQARTGLRSFACSSSGYLYANVPSSAVTPYVAISFRSSTSDQWLDLRFRESTTIHLSIYIDYVGGTISVRRSTTTLAVATGFEFRVNTWYTLEAQGTIHDSTGTVTVRLNGVTVAALSLTGADTRNSAGGVCNNVGIANSNGTAYFDDIVMASDAFPGPVGVYVLTVDSNGTTTAWTASSANPWECVDEIPAGTADYVYTGATPLNTKHDFGLTALPGPFNSVAAVAAIAYANLNAAGNGTARTYISSGGSIVSGSGVSLNTAPVFITQYLAYDPNGSVAWGTASIASMLIGVETV